MRLLTLDRSPHCELPVVQCRMPIREEIFTVRPGSDWQAPVQITQLKRRWLLVPTLSHSHARPRRCVLRLAVNTLGYLFLWPTAVLARESQQRASLQRLLLAAEKGWVQGQWVDGLWRFERVTLHKSPSWPEWSLDELALAAFPEASKYVTGGAR